MTEVRTNKFIESESMTFIITYSILILALQMIKDNCANAHYLISLI